MGPGLWISVNPGYVHANKAFFTSSTHKVHEYDPKKGWADKVDKTHHLKQDDFMAFAAKLRPMLQSQENKLMFNAPWGPTP